MEKREQFVIELFLGILLILLLIFFVIIFIGVSKSNNKSIKDASNSYIVNSYNVYNIYGASNAKSYTQHRTISSKYRDCDDYNENYLTYTHKARYEKVEGVLGNEIDKYKVYVTNKERVGGYFEVIFSFTDYYGKTITKSVAHYIKAGEEKEFTYRRVYDEYEIRDWSYKVISQTELPDAIRNYRAKKGCY